MKFSEFLNDVEDLNESFKLSTAIVKVKQAIDKQWQYITVKSEETSDGFILTYVGSTGGWSEPWKETMGEIVVKKLLPKMKWVDKLFKVTYDVKVTRTYDVMGEDGKETWREYSHRIEFKAKDKSMIFYDNLENDLKLLPKEALLALQDMLQEPKNLSKLLNSIISKK